MLTKEELYHLQDLAAVKIERDQEDSFLEKLKNIVTYLDLLNEIDTDSIAKVSNIWKNNSQKMLDETTHCRGSKEILSNVGHEVINNCVVIKSVLS